MNNDDLPLTVYGLRPGCYVTLKLHNSKHKHGHRRKSASREPASVSVHMYKDKDSV